MKYQMLIIFLVFGIFQIFQYFRNFSKQVSDFSFKSIFFASNKFIAFDDSIFTNNEGDSQYLIKILKKIYLLILKMKLNWLII